jgi:hypothetical protein
MNSSPRRAFCLSASWARWRRTDSSISLMVPFELGYLPFAQAGGQLLFHLMSRL